MGIFDFAMKMEKDGEAYYRLLAEKTDDPGIKVIFNMMADEEVKHYETFDAMNAGGGEMMESEIMSSVKNVFEELASRGGGKHVHDDPVKQYEAAQQIEKRSERIYRETGEAVEEDYLRSLLFRIADEEKRHYIILENLIEMVQRPKTWIENAEWRHSEEY